MNLGSARTIAVVGLSANEEKASNRVAKYLKQNGYKIIPVNPKEQEILGEKSYPDLLTIPKDIELDIVDIFRKSEAVGEIVDQAIDCGAKMIWMQEGVINQEAKEKALAAGLDVEMDKCIMKVHRK